MQLGLMDGEKLPLQLSICIRRPAPTSPWPREHEGPAGVPGMDGKRGKFIS